MNILSLFKRKATKDPIVAKDPMDYKLTSSSTPWNREDYCPLCKAKTGHSEYMTNICNSCGGFGNSFDRIGQDRSVRKIWDGKEWVTQHKYGNGKDDYTIDGKKQI